MPSHRLRILHISDLHERVALDGMSDDRQAKVRLHAAGRHRVLAANLAEVLHEIRNDAPVQLVCFTGDVADWGLPEEYEQATARLQSMLDAVGVPRQQLYVIPGNHDVQRTKATNAWKQLRKLVAENPVGLSEWMGGMDPPYGAQAKWRNAIGERTEAFWRWTADQLDRAELDPRQGPHGRLGYRVPVEGLGLPFPVHVIGLDSAWLCGDDHDTGQYLSCRSTRSASNWALTPRG